MSERESGLKQEFEDLLEAKSEELHARIKEGNLYEAVRLIQEIQDAREQTLYMEVGRLTRALHSAITNFHVDGTSDGEVSNLSEMADATDRLSHVVKMTEDAANKTMDKVDDCMPIARDIGEVASDLQSEWKRLRDRDMSPDEFRELYWRIDQFLERLNGDSQALYGHLSDILMAQDFQDLTGQLIQRVTGLVRDVEVSLVDLMRMASKVEGVAGLADRLQQEAETEAQENEPDADKKKKKDDDPLKGHGPSIEDSDDVMSSQDDVDDLLSSLGF